MAGEVSEGRAGSAPGEPVQAHRIPAAKDVLLSQEVEVRGGDTGVKLVLLSLSELIPDRRRIR
jgi:hypothetical protein